MNQEKSTRLLSPTEQFSILLSSTPRGARLARLLAAEWMRIREMPHRVTEAAEHLVAELAANAATHGRLPGRDFRLVLRARSETLRIEVTDTRGDDLPRHHPATPTPSQGAASSSSRPSPTAGASSSAPSLARRYGQNSTCHAPDQCE